MIFSFQERSDTIHTQFKKGVLELLVLSIVDEKDVYGYELVEKVREAVDVNEGTIYPILKRLTNEGFFETYLVESKEGPTSCLLYTSILFKDVAMLNYYIEYAYKKRIVSHKINKELTNKLSLILKLLYGLKNVS